MIPLMIAKNPIASLLGVLLLAACVAAGTLHIKLKGARADLVAANARELVCEVNNNTLESAVTQQNDAVEREAAEAKRSAEKSAERALDVLSKPLPVPSAPGADAMNQWLDTFR